MRSKVAQRILDNTPQHIKDSVREYSNNLIKNQNMTKYQIQKDTTTNTIILVEDVEDIEMNPIILDTDVSDINFWEPKIGLYIQDTEFEVEEIEIERYEGMYHLVAKPLK